MAAAYQQVGLDWREFVSRDQALFRPAEIRSGLGDARQARDVLGWEAKSRMMDVARNMVRAECNRLELEATG